MYEKKVTKVEWRSSSKCNMKLIIRECKSQIKTVLFREQLKLAKCYWRWCKVLNKMCYFIHTHSETVVTCNLIDLEHISLLSFTLLNWIEFILLLYKITCTDYKIYENIYKIITKYITECNVNNLVWRINTVLVTISMKREH